VPATRQRKRAGPGALGRDPALGEAEQHPAGDRVGLLQADRYRIAQTVARAGALAGESDHGVNKSLYARDPDGLEFEVTYVVPPEYWGDEEHEAIIRRLDLDAERTRFDGVVSHVGSARP